MFHQLPQVLLTYATRRSLWLIVGIGVLGFGPTALLTIFRNGSVRDSAAPAAMFAVGFAAAMVAFVVATQAKWQFCDARARLLPGFARPHAAVLLAILLIGCGLYPAFLAVAGRWNMLGVAACSIAIAAPFIWSIHRPHWLPTLLALAALFSLMTPQGIDFWILPTSFSRFAPLHAAILLAGWAALIQWLRRLAAIREDDDDFGIPIQAQQGSATRMERTQAARALGRHFLRSSWQRVPADRWHDRLARIHAATVPARQRLLRYGFAPTPIWVNAALMALTFFAVFLLISRVTFGRSNDGHANLSSISMMIIMPAMMAGGMLAMRRARMSQELLLPLTRRDYLNGLFRVAAESAVIVWLPIYAAFLGLIAVLMPERLTLPFVAALTALSLGVQIYAYGVLVWIARKSSGGVRLVASMLVVVPAMIALNFGLESLPAAVVSPAEFDRRIEAEFQSTYGTVAKDLPDDARVRILGQIRTSYERRYGRTFGNDYVPWAIALVLTSIGLAAFTYSRRCWLDLELA